MGAIAALLWCSAASAAAERKGGRPVLAYQVHDVQTALVKGPDGSDWLRVSAKGLAPHPGYGNPRLVAVNSSSHGRLLRLRFLIDPPPRNPDVSWPMVLADVEAVGLFAWHKQERVRVRGYGRPVMSRIDPTAPTFPSSWGRPPKFQTKDWRPLPAGYGYGSSTLAQWILRHLSAR